MTAQARPSLPANEPLATSRPSFGAHLGALRSQYPESQFTDTSSFDAALVDLGLGPNEWLGVLIVGVDEGIDVLPELLDRGE